MSLQIQTKPIDFATPGTFLISFDFKNTVKDFGVAFKGMEMKYRQSQDHSIKAIGMEITDSYLSDNDNVVNVKVEFTLNDHKNKNEGEGIADIVVLADVIGRTPN